MQRSRPGGVATTLDIVCYTPAWAEAGKFQRRTHVFYVDWSDYQNHTMQGYSGIAIQAALSNNMTVLAFSYEGTVMKIGTAIDDQETVTWRRTI
jgi:hypothetical protein